MAKIVDRVAAYRFNTSDMGTSTTIFFANGKEVTVDGHLHLPHNITLEVRYEKRDDPEPHAIKGIKTIAG